MMGSLAGIGFWSIRTPSVLTTSSRCYARACFNWTVASHVVVVLTEMVHELRRLQRARAALRQEGERMLSVGTAVAQPQPSATVAGAAVSGGAHSWSLGPARSPLPAFQEATQPYAG